MPGSSRDRFVELLFKAWSPIYDRPIFQRTFYRRVHEAVLAAIDVPHPRHIVNLGCGTGQLTGDLSQRFRHAAVVGIDLSKDMLRAAHKRLPGQRPALAAANVYALPLVPESIDLLTSTISYHWYREPARALAEIRQALRPDGQLVLATLAAPYLHHMFPGTRIVSASETASDLEAAGFRVRKITRVRPWVAILDAR